MSGQSRVAVALENVSKVYHLGTISSRSLREGFASGFRRLLGQGETAAADELWAVRDVSFTVRHGEALGIIGKNGAGKSTLLKLLSRITEPSHGRITIDGRISSLLEVGTGFHPELTGSENIYLNGSILGMTRAEIRRKYDEIVAFSGVEKFLETPVKRYSSGMYVRLAFAVAAHLEPEILIIDEVLAVGDAEFQKKCLGKMNDAATQGRTVLFVSHNMAAVEKLCTRTIYIRNGAVAADGPTSDVITTYMHDASEGASRFVDGELRLSGPGRTLQRIALRCDGRPSSTAYMGCDLEVEVDFESATPIRYPVLGFVVKDRYETPLLGINNRHYTGNLVGQPVFSGSVSMKIKAAPFMPGEYSVDVHFGDGSADLDLVRDAFLLAVEGRGFTEAGMIPNPSLNRFCIKEVEWTYHQVATGSRR